MWMMGMDEGMKDKETEPTYRVLAQADRDHLEQRHVVGEELLVVKREIGTLLRLYEPIDVVLREKHVEGSGAAKILEQD